MGLENFNDTKEVAVYAFNVAISSEEKKLVELYERYGRNPYGWRKGVVESQEKIINDLKTVKRKKL